MAGARDDIHVGIAKPFSGLPHSANAALIKGIICGYRIEEIENPLTRQVRYPDKVVDELARGKKTEKILRES